MIAYHVVDNETLQIPDSECLIFYKVWDEIIYLSWGEMFTMLKTGDPDLYMLRFPDYK